MFDTIVILSCMEALVLWLLDVSDCLNFVTAITVVFFFALLFAWSYAKDKKL